MAAGKKLNNAVIAQGRSYMDQFGITLAAAQNLKQVLVVGGADGSAPLVIAWYNGSGAITTSLYAGFPLGSIIIDLQAHKTHEKAAVEGTDTWVSSAARS